MHKTLSNITDTSIINITALLHHYVVGDSVHQPKLTKPPPPPPKKKKKKIVYSRHTHLLTFSLADARRDTDSEIEQAQGVCDTYWTLHN